MIFNEGRILDIIELTTEYDIPIISDIALRARTEITTEGSNSNLIIILKDRASNSELSNVPEDFKNITVNNININIKELQLKKRKLIYLIILRRLLKKLFRLR